MNADVLDWCPTTGHQLTPVPEDSTCAAADSDRYSNRCQGNGVAIAVNGCDGGSVARGRSATSPRPPPVAKRSCLRQTTDSRAPAAVSDLELPRSPRRVDLQRLPARLRVTGNNSAPAATDQDCNDNDNQNGNNDDTTATTTMPANYDTEHLSVDPALFPLGVRLTTVWQSDSTDWEFEFKIRAFLLQIL